MMSGLFWLSDLDDQLEAYGRVVDFAAFRRDLEKALAYRTGRAMLVIASALIKNMRGFPVPIAARARSLL